VENTFHGMEKDMAEKDMAEKDMAEKKLAEKTWRTSIR
jgi:hypothetical protein